MADSVDFKLKMGINTDVPAGGVLPGHIHHTFLSTGVFASGFLFLPTPITNPRIVSTVRHKINRTNVIQTSS